MYTPEFILFNFKMKFKRNCFFIDILELSCSGIILLGEWIGIFSNPFVGKKFIYCPDDGVVAWCMLKKRPPRKRWPQKLIKQIKPNLSQQTRKVSLTILVIGFHFIYSSFSPIATIGSIFGFPAGCTTCVSGSMLSAEPS